MAIMYKPGRRPTINTEPELTEQEHKKSCDANLMIKNAMKGMQVRGGKPPQYGHDDTTLSTLDVKIMKQNLEEQLSKLTNSPDLTQKTLDLIPDSIKKKFGLKPKQQTEVKTNDDLTTKKPDLSTSTKNPDSPTQQPKVD